MHVASSSQGQLLVHEQRLRTERTPAQKRPDMRDVEDANRSGAAADVSDVQAAAQRAADIAERMRLRQDDVARSIGALSPTVVNQLVRDTQLDTRA